jgi:hypothetical protein
VCPEAPPSPPHPLPPLRPCSALQEAKFPPGLRLLILHHVNQFRQPSNVLKLALPPPRTPAQMRPPPRAPVPAVQMQQRA